MAVHTIVVTLQGNSHAVPVPDRTVARVGDELQFDTEPKGLAFRVEFPGTPFTKVPARIIKDREPHPLNNQGRFFLKCFLERSSGQELVGWASGKKPESGGEVDVRP